MDITVIGAGLYGTRIAGKYIKSKATKVRAIVSLRPPKSGIFSDVPNVKSAVAWKKRFGKPGDNDVFDICVHQGILIKILDDFVKIGAKNFILPKPIALSQTELGQIEKIIIKNRLKVLVASQWHYSTLVKEIGSFVSKNRRRISRVDICFSRSFSLDRLKRYSVHTAFLPHIVQILADLKLISGKADLAIGGTSEHYLKMRYSDSRLVVNVESSLSSNEGGEKMKVYLEGEAEPSLVADFSGKFDVAGAEIYPSLTITGKKKEVHEDVLEKMLEKSLPYFCGKSSNSAALTFEKYLPVASELARIIDKSKKLVVIVGGGIFGILSALEIAAKGYSAVILEREDEIIRGASLVNQCRVHMGYHYPRDEDTAMRSRQAMAKFEEVFGSKVVRKLDNYYMIAEEGSLTSKDQMLAFCKKMDLPYEIAWPKKTGINRDMISLSLKVPEHIFDANRLRDALANKLAISTSITLITSANVVAIKKNKAGYSVSYNKDNKVIATDCSVVVNATYAGANHINKMAGFKIESYQFELCEVPVVKAPWSGTGWSVIDGPFFGVMPFGYAEEYLLYDVELSVLERSIGKIPNFKFDVGHYMDQGRAAQRFARYQNKWRPWLKEVDKLKYMHSMYVIRVVLPHKDKTDTRPTMIKNISSGFWQLFSGKITTSVPNSKALAEMVDDYLKSKSIW